MENYKWNSNVQTSVIELVLSWKVFMLPNYSVNFYGYIFKIFMQYLHCKKRKVASKKVISCFYEVKIL